MTSFSQIEMIEIQIAEYDAKIIQAIEEEMEFITPHISTTCPLMLPAIGLVNHKIDIYFDLNRDESEKGLSEMKSLATIRKVYFKVVSGSYQYDYTFHFNPEGSLIFYSLKSEDSNSGCTLDSYYFKNAKCIQIRTEPFPTKFCEVPSENVPEIRTVLTEQDESQVIKIIKNTTTFKNLLSIYKRLMVD